MADKTFTPFPVLKTARLTMRQLAHSDVHEVFDLRSDGNVNKYLDRARSQSLDDAKNFIQAINKSIQKNDSFYWAITLHDTDKLIGTICLFNFSQDHSKAEIGYELLPGFQGKGIMQEAVSKVIYFGFHHAGLTSIEAVTHAENQSSTRLLEKLNFKRESVVDENCLLFRLTHNG
jgi:ribosomal-protein-alanine N-acetyltransferase